MVSRASTLLRKSGAKPPSSPTAVLRPWPFSTDFSEWKISVPARRASEKEEAPTGRTMNSWKSTLLSACAPPLMMFIIGTGSETLDSVMPAMYCHSGCFFEAATAWAAASETPSSALAPRRPLFSVPSRSIRRRSRPCWSAVSKPARASAMAPLTLATAFFTPLPRYRVLSPSPSSTASLVPVEAPDGTAARPKEPSARVTSASRVGLPRLSRISRAWILAMLVMEMASVRWVESPRSLTEPGPSWRLFPRSFRHLHPALRCPGNGWRPRDRGPAAIAGKKTGALSGAPVGRHPRAGRRRPRASERLLDEAVLLGDRIQRQQGFQQRLHLAQRPGIGPVGQGLGRIRVGLGEQAGHAHGHGGARQHRHELALAAGAGALAAWQLHRVGGVEHHRAAGLAHHAQRAHVTDQVVVAEAGAAFAD